MVMYEPLPKCITSSLPCKVTKDYCIFKKENEPGEYLYCICCTASSLLTYMIGCFFNTLEKSAWSDCLRRWQKNKSSFNWNHFQTWTKPHSAMNSGTYFSDHPINNLKLDANGHYQSLCTQIIYFRDYCLVCWIACLMSAKGLLMS